MDFMNNFLCIDYDKTIQGICDYAAKNELFCNAAPALDAVLKYKNHKENEYSFSDMKYAVNKVICDTETRAYFGINKNLNIINEIAFLADADVGKDFGKNDIFFSANICMKSDNVGRIEALIRSGVFYEHDLTADDFENKDKIEKMYLEFTVVLSENEAYIITEVRNHNGRSCGKFTLTESEIESLHEMIIEETHKDQRLAYRIGNTYLTFTAEYAEYEIVEDNCEYDNGLMIIYYTDETHEDEISHTCIDLDHLENHLPVGFPYENLDFEKTAEKRNKKVDIER